MRILIFHGYLLQGTGSNVYNAELAAALVRAGHEVHLLCQDRDPLALEWVDAAGDWDGGALRFTVRREPARATVYRPDIAGLLPLYVADRYEGVDARPFDELDDFELDRYLGANVAAVREVAERVRPDVALANHLVMGPVILARALRGVPYAVKIHGSALEYVVKPHPRFLPYATEGLSRANGVLVGSRHTAESLWATMDDPDLPARTRLGPPGVDIARFAPRDHEAAYAGLEALRARLASSPTTEPLPDDPDEPTTSPPPEAPASPPPATAVSSPAAASSPPAAPSAAADSSSPPAAPSAAADSSSPPAAPSAAADSSSPPAAPSAAADSSSPPAAPSAAADSSSPPAAPSAAADSSSPPAAPVSSPAPASRPAAAVSSPAPASRPAAAVSAPAPASPPATAVSSPAPAGSSFARRPGEGADALATVGPGDRLVVFVGKLIASKGVELLIAAWPLVLAREPRARLVVVGFGAFRDGLERLAGQLAAGDLDAAGATRGENGQALPQLRAFLAGLEDRAGYAAAARGLADRVAWAGRLDHAELADLLPAAEAMAVTSTFPEAFGMVAAEAAACGALPVVANHSGLGEVARTLGASVPEAARAWLSFELGDDSVTQLAAALSGWLAAPEDLRAATREAIVAATRARYSWDGVGKTVIAAAQGELAGLPHPT